MQRLEIEMIDRRKVKNDSGSSGLLFDIERFALHDGGGIRTLIFTKGCPLRCRWCANPEGMKPSSELFYNKEKCLRCGNCIESCPQKATALSEEGELITDRQKCTACGTCSTVCPPKARQIWGKKYSVQEVISIVERDRIFYEKSNGGITIGGGCPLLQPEFTFQLLKEAKSRGLHTAMETCGLTSWENFQRILEYLDLLFLDIKCMDSRMHQVTTGVPNEIILDNARKASNFFLSAGKTMIIRIPVIPGYTDSEENIRATAEFVDNQLKGVKEIELLPYHRLGISKYEWLGRSYELNDLSPLDDQQMQRLKNIARDSTNGRLVIK